MKLTYTIFLLALVYSLSAASIKHETIETVKIDIDYSINGEQEAVLVLDPENLTYLANPDNNDSIEIPPKIEKEIRSICLAILSKPFFSNAEYEEEKIYIDINFGRDDVIAVVRNFHSKKEFSSEYRRLDSIIQKLLKR